MPAVKGVLRTSEPRDSCVQFIADTFKNKLAVYIETSAVKSFHSRVPKVMSDQSHDATTMMIYYKSHSRRISSNSITQSIFKSKVKNKTLSHI